MKNVFIIACALFASLFVNAAEESTVKEVIAVVPQECSPTGVKSIPNKQGDVIEIYHRTDRDDTEGFDVAAIRKSDGKLYFLCEWEYGRVRPIEVDVTTQILWLSDREFACVSSGRKFSHYAIFRIDTANASIPQTIDAMTIVRGYACYRVMWEVEGDTLVGYDRYEEKSIVLKS